MPAPPKSQAATSNASPPPMWKVHGALILTQCIFGGGAIVGKFGISNFNPVLFALIRECSAGPILLAIAYITQRNSFFIKKKDILTFGVAGFCLFSNQLGFITGVKLASAVIGSAWQPSQPIFLASISVLLGWERATVLKIGGILLAFVGAAFMVVTSRTEFGVIDIGLGDQTLSGNCLFFFNCLGTALFVIFARKLLESYPSAVVTGWAYMFACVQMVVAATFINQVPGGLEFVCPPEDDDAADASPSAKRGSNLTDKVKVIETHDREKLRKVHQLDLRAQQLARQQFPAEIFMIIISISISIFIFKNDGIDEDFRVET
ncbi:hypothetical protein ScalyP_jg984 [Parmales sp. scaly parma]|nr:hypothetical protein ScalyP_jg984 [Parmales sp. scaly parma]